MDISVKKTTKKKPKQNKNRVNQDTFQSLQFDWKCILIFATYFSKLQANFKHYKNSLFNINGAQYVFLIIRVFLLLNTLMQVLGCYLNYFCNK